MEKRNNKVKNTTNLQTVTSLTINYAWCKVTLAKNNWAHWIQAHFTYLQSSYNQPSFLSACPRHSSASLQHPLFIFGHMCSSIYIIFSTNNRSIASSMLPLVLWHYSHWFHRFTTFIIHHPFSLSFHAWNLPFVQILPTIASLFFFRIDSVDSPGCYWYFSAYLFLLFVLISSTV